MKYTCSSCGQQIPAGLAIIRSISLQRVAFHRECWAAQHSPAVVPAQRAAADQAPVSA